MMYYSVMTQAYSQKRNSEFSQQESNLVTYYLHVIKNIGKRHKNKGHDHET